MPATGRIMTFFEALSKHGGMSEYFDANREPGAACKDSPAFCGNAPGPPAIR
jgi:hypothetical protein